MKAASVQEIRQALKNMDTDGLVDIGLRLARFKKENKELLTYLLFEEADADSFIRNVKAEIDLEFGAINQSSVYLVKKSVRKILRLCNRYIRYTGSKTAEVEILLHFCTSFKGLRAPISKSTALMNLYASQIKKVSATIASMHEDLQYDYLKMLRRLE